MVNASYLWHREGLDDAEIRRIFRVLPWTT